jgi:hypothetical protein
VEGNWNWEEFPSSALVSFRKHHSPIVPCTFIHLSPMLYNLKNWHHRSITHFKHERIPAYIAIMWRFVVTFFLSWKTNNDYIRIVMQKWFYVVGNSETQLDANVKCPIFLSDCNQIWFFYTQILKSLQNQISRKSVRLWLSWYMRTDRHEKDNRRFMLLMRTRLNVRSDQNWKPNYLWIASNSVPSFVTIIIIIMVLFYFCERLEICTQILQTIS